MKYNIFTSEIWKTKLEYDKKNELIEIIEKSYFSNPNQTPPKWNCKVHSSFGKEFSLIPNDLVNLLQEKVDKYVKTNKNNFNLDGKYFINEIWFNAYKHEQFQEPHTHGNTLFSGCYYLKFNKKIHHQTTFYNPNYNIDFFKVKNNSYFSVEIDCDEDDVIIFPSFLRHGTNGMKDKSKDVELRITISFNVENSFINSKKIKKLKRYYT